MSGQRNQVVALTVAGTLALAGAAMAQPTGFAAGLYYFPDYTGLSTTSVTQNNYPSVLQITEQLPVRPAGAGGVSRHVGTFTSGPNTPFVVPNSNFGWSYQVTIQLDGAGVNEGGLHIGSLGAFPPGNVGAITGQVVLNANSGEIAAFGAWLPFFSNNQAQYSSLPRAQRGVPFTLGFSATPNAGSIDIRYSINGTIVGPFTLDPGALNFYNAINNTAGVYVQNEWRNTGPTTGQGTFTNWQYVPAPGSAGLLALGGLLAARRRRA
jgi:hypothetical protein